MKIRHKTFCTKCYESVPFHIISQEDTISVREVAFTFERTMAICDICGTEVYVPAVNDRNVMERQKAYYKTLEGLTDGNSRLGSNLL